ncbi:hypothetical protein SAMN06297144_2448 [Sphingomonas guangdongensis]|uniref:Hpr(Ser) kinase/phosphatase n=1 Tax=Sphingomonas guangdongensis TaxID=1141890 RepID=A0A285R0L1_9SPHN|nr:hypothetical protein [Sphingomonas guangdongensis]SOB87318.1 hypothetical protein SAMN06297144_2448 [Sphingomonas guangdongensis]
MPALPRYACFDFTFDTDVPLGELREAAADDVRPIVRIRHGNVPAGLEGAGAAEYGVSAAGSRALLDVPETARYLVESGERITVATCPDASPRNVRLFLLGSALGILAYQRGLLPLHANAVVVDGGAHAFSGPSGAGKSTLAAHFAKAGLEVLCDDVCTLSFDASGAALAWPGLPRVKLWADAASALGHDPAALEQAIEGQAKYHVPIAGARRDTAVPLRRLYLLARAGEGEAGTITRLTGAAAMAAVLENSYRHEYLDVLGVRAWHFARAAAMLRHVEVWQVRRPWGFGVFEEAASRLAAHLRS